MPTLTREQAEAAVQQLTPSQRHDWERHIRRQLWLPLCGPQMRAYYSAADELYYGGSAGGGKTELLLGLAITAHTKSVIFRREFVQLEGLVQRSREILSGSTARFNGSSLTWFNLPELPHATRSRSLQFGAVQREDDVTKYQGRPRDLTAFDELPNFAEYQYQFLIGWARTTVPQQRVRVVGGGNPPTTTEGAWVIRRWAPWIDDHYPHPAADGELRWFASLDGRDTEVDGPAAFEWHGEQIKPRSRTFIAARLRDNPFLAATGYESVLQGLPEPLRSQLLQGDFTAGLTDDAWQIIPTAWVRAAMARWTPDGAPRYETDSAEHLAGDRVPLAALGADPARGGQDNTVLAPRYGTWYAPLRKYAGKATPTGPAVAALILQALGPDVATTPVNLDVIGIGSSVYDSLAPVCTVVAVNFSAKSGMTDRSGRLRMTNVRAEYYWRMREALDPEHGDNLALPNDPELLADLCAARYSVSAAGVKVEDKEEIKARLGRSPDCGDAAVLALYESGCIIGFIR
jgi:hypothetical protein